MGKLDLSRFRYMSKDHLRMLTSVEIGMKNHAEVPDSLVVSISGLRNINHHAIMRDLVKDRLVRRGGGATPGFHLTTQGYDYLALNTLVLRGIIGSVGSRIGVGKEADVYSAYSPDGTPMVLKFARLGRTSFHNVRSKRDYLEGRRGTNFLYLGRLAAAKEANTMIELHRLGYPVPRVLDFNRHLIAMDVACGELLANIRVMTPAQAERTCSMLLTLAVALARAGIVHCDFNEFNLFVDLPENDEDLDGINVQVIDFPQVIATTHPNARTFFQRDVNGIKTFFTSRFKFTAETVPSFDHDAAPAAAAAWAKAHGREVERVDMAVGASGTTKASFDMIAEMMQQARQEEQEESESESESDEEYEEEEEEEDSTPAPAATAPAPEVEADATVAAAATAVTAIPSSLDSFMELHCDWVGTEHDASIIQGADSADIAAAGAAGARVGGQLVAATTDANNAMHNATKRAGKRTATAGGTGQRGVKADLTAAQQAAIRKKVRARK